MFPNMLLLSALFLLKGSFGRNLHSKALALIVGGKTANIEDFPYQISLQSYESHFCGGSIVTLRHIVTAAHCTDGRSASTLSIRAGSSNRFLGGDSVKVGVIHQHPRYNKRAIDYDVSVLQLSSAIYSPVARSISLSPPGKETPAGATAVVSGWGYLWKNGPSPSKLQAVEVPIISSTDCSKAYNPVTITDRMICAGYLGTGGKGFCQGDSGGPLAVKGQLVGIVSWAYGCADPKYPLVYAKVSNPGISSFIRKVTGTTRKTPSVSLAQRFKALLP